MRIERCDSPCTLRFAVYYPTIGRTCKVKVFSWILEGHCAQEAGAGEAGCQGIDPGSLQQSFYAYPSLNIISGRNTQSQTEPMLAYPF
jgi:hypothetical protein